MDLPMLVNRSVTVWSTGLFPPSQSSTSHLPKAIAYKAHRLARPVASLTPNLFIRAYQNLKPTHMAATAKLHAAQVKFPVGYPLVASLGLQIHCAII